MTWILVFWLAYPENHSVMQEYVTKRECKDAEQAWQRRLQTVRSPIIAECRLKEKE